MRQPIAILAFSLSIAAAALAADGAPTIKRVPLRPSSAVSGKEMFSAYCSACHGSTGRGDGPAAAGLKKLPPDLTRLAATNGGKYPEFRVAEALSTTDAFAHSSQEMPTWGELFRSLGSGTNDQVQMRITNLTAYIKSIQEK